MLTVQLAVSGLFHVKKTQKGFTLIELTSTIAVLGILSAVALPRFVAIQTDARIAKMSMALGSLQSAAVLAHALQVTQNLAPGSSISMEGSLIGMANGYPQSSEIAIGHAAGFITAAGTPNADYQVTSNGTLFTVAADSHHPLCAVSYRAPSFGSSPNYSKAGLTPANCA